MNIKPYVWLALALISNAIYAQNIITTVDKSVPLVVVKSSKGIGAGTGYIVSKGIVVTNFHVAGDAEKIVLLLKSDTGETKRYQAKLIWGSPERDLALLEAPELYAPPLELYVGPLAKGSQVISIGYPGQASTVIDPELKIMETTATQGIVGRVLNSTWGTNSEKFDIVQHSASVNRGNSGGPLIDMCGRVVGTNTLASVGSIEGNKSDGYYVSQTEGIFFASHISALLSGLKAKGIGYIESNIECSPSATTIAINTKVSPNNWVITSGIIAALLLAFGALFFSLRKSKVIRETFTQYKRRSSQAKPLPSNKSNQRDREAKWLLKGSDSNNRNISLSLDSSAFNYGNVTIGRDSSVCQLVIDDTSVSREHASFSLSAERLMIKDLGSKNGTWIDGEKVGNQPVTIRLGQTVTLGKVKLRVDGARS